MSTNKPLNIYIQPGVYGPRTFSIENYRYYCDRIKQFYKKFNIEEDEKYLTYLTLNSEEDKEQFISEIVTKKRNRKIDLILS